MNGQFSPITREGFFFLYDLVLQVVNLFLCLAVKRLSDQFIASNHRDVLWWALKPFVGRGLIPLVICSLNLRASLVG